MTNVIKHLNLSETGFREIVPFDEPVYVQKITLSPLQVERQLDLKELNIIVTQEVCVLFNEKELDFYDPPKTKGGYAKRYDDHDMVIKLFVKFLSSFLASNHRMQSKLILSSNCDFIGMCSNHYYEFRRV